MARPEIFFDSAEEAQRRLDAFENHAPPMLSAYQPSGQGTVEALPYLAVGGAAAGAVTVAVGGGTVAAGTVVVWGLAEMLAWAAEGGIIHIGLFIVMCVFGLVALVGAAGLPGLLAGMCMGWFSRLGSGRSWGLAALLAAAGAVAGVAVYHRLLLPRFVAWLPVGKYLSATLEAVFGSGAVGWIVLVVLAAVTALVAAGRAVAAVEDSKFCEPCGVFMSDRRLPSLSMDAAERLVGTMNAGDLDGALAALGGPGGCEVRPVLFRCPHCGRGYLEAPFKVVAIYRDPKTKRPAGNLERSWLAGSWELARDQAERLAAIPLGGT